ncbi:hypothetical protein AGMMS49587_10290 [Spirochaetia bacterium]|nr:hypothetical protein AGMMS49587_10290 [Spirochaetia bacterium]
MLYNEAIMKKILLLLCIIQLFSSCAKKAFSAAGRAEAASYDSASSKSQYRSNDAETFNPDVSRKFIVTASLTLHLTDLEKGEAILTEIMGKYNAYTTETSIYNDVLYYTIKVPADIYKECFEELKTIGKIEYFDESREDVTLNYYDLEGRLNTKRELMKKYQEYLGKAANIEEIMTVEKQIAELQNEIERMGKDFTKLNNSIDFSTIRLALNGPRNNSVYYTESIGDKIKNLFNGFGGYVSTTITILIGLIIYGIPTLIILLLLYLLLFGKIGILKKVWRLLNDKKIKNIK